MANLIRKLGVFFACSVVLPKSAWAGLLLAPSLAWSSYAPRPVQEEHTPNYYGYSGGVHAGYSAFQKIDLSLFADYTPGSLSAPNPLSSTSHFLQYGAGFGLRIQQAVYFGLHAGMAQYGLSEATKAEELSGAWVGNLVGLRIGGLIPVSRTMAWQLALGISRATLSPEGGEAQSDRVMDHFSLSLSFVYNGKDSLGFVDAIFQNSINSLFR